MKTRVHSVRVKKMVQGEVLKSYIAGRPRYKRQDLADELFVHPSYITHMIAGRRFPSEEIRRQLVKITGLSEDILFRDVVLDKTYV